MQPIQAADYSIVFNTTGYEYLNTHIKEGEYTQLYIIVDTNTHEHCLPTFLSLLETTTPIEVIEIPNGEINKTIQTCSQVWQALAELNADRKCLIINLGGGVVTDLGGFVASTFKRGVKFVNIPTTLLSMVDASVGGKTGVDLGTLKNLVGVINNPELVLIDTGFLATLSSQEMRSGLAEVYKHGLIANAAYWKKLVKLNELTTDDLNTLIYESVLIKNKVVLEDPTEQNLRKTLNYGHTLGHAIESFCLASEKRDTLLHGEAIAIGMILESYLSHNITGLPEEQLEEITEVLSDMYDVSAFAKAEIDTIIDLMKYDKKNEKGAIQFVLLNKIGASIVNQKASNDLIYSAFEYYKSKNQ